MEPYPHKAIDLIVPFPPAGITDLAARSVAAWLSRRWKHPVNVVNKPGGGGTAGTMLVLRSAGDGYTMLMCATGQATQNPAIDPGLPYRWDDPTPVARINASPLVFAVKGDSPWSSLKQVMDDVAREPERYRYATSGAGGVGSLVLARLLHAAGISPGRVGRIVLQGGAAILEAVATGHTHFAAQYLAEMKPVLESRVIKPLAVSAATRVTQLPAVPSGREAGYPGFNLVGWNGIAGPAALGESVIAAWNQALQEMVRDAAFLAGIEATGGSAAYLGPAEFKAALQAEYAAALEFAGKLGLQAGTA
jgi:tripartite-type tricarboxylate transporter receptor subunit TctC